MSEVFLYAKTPRGNVQYCVNFFVADTSILVNYLNVQFFNLCCRKGCPNYGLKWSCPPYAPKYENYVKNFDFIQIIFLKIELSQFAYIKQNYLKVKAANSILKSRIDKAMRCFINESVFYISTGSCRLCKPCRKKKNLPCAHPELMSYSFEALGINVCNLVHDLFDTDLLWYSKHNLPQYTCVVGGLLCNKMIESEKLIEVLKSFQ